MLWLILLVTLGVAIALRPRPLFKGLGQGLGTRVGGPATLDGQLKVSDSYRNAPKRTMLERSAALTRQEIRYFQLYGAPPSSEVDDDGSGEDKRSTSSSLGSKPGTLLENGASKLSEYPQRSDKGARIRRSDALGGENLTPLVIGTVLLNNPFGRILTNTYSFFWNLPKKNIPYDSPWQLFKNSSAEWIAWYQFPHNLPPYLYLGNGFREDMFCYGLEGNTLPLGNWDPAGFQLVSYKVVKKYRESELKHGRVAMLASVGFFVQELFHPIFPKVGGMSITHMAQIRELEYSMTSRIDELQALLTDPRTFNNLHFALPQNTPSLPYIAIMSVLISFEVYIFQCNWIRWRDDEYNHQFDHNIGIGNLRDSYAIGDLNFDPLGLFPDTKQDQRLFKEIELNHGRLAMVAIIGMIGQEYLTGVPVTAFVYDFLASSGAMAG